MGFGLRERHPDAYESAKALGEGCPWNMDHIHLSKGESLSDLENPARITESKSQNMKTVVQQTTLKRSVNPLRQRKLLWTDIAIFTEGLRGMVNGACLNIVINAL